MQATSVVISGSGPFTARYSISNVEIVASYNAYARQFNAGNAARVAARDLGVICSLGAGYSTGSAVVRKA